ncbi:MAG: SDR family oxidoreductase [Verrucomicrobia bacterium]|nr:SDR family oxidoreductase [Verrucomicrobiota bacterium]MBU1908569.1 SDR family oxidoreductase [Verrucomicrobiota bacterium]
MNLGIRNRKALVGGASAGLGLAVARALEQEGCEVAIVSRSAERLRKAAATFPPDARVMPIEADLSTSEGIAACLAAADAWGPVDILVNNTGGPPAGRTFDHDDATWQQACESILTYVRRMCGHFVPGMRARRWGRIITITSLTVKEPAANLVLSNVFRAGVTAYLKILARDVAPDGITVNTVLPGAYLTARYEQLIDNTVRQTGKNREPVMQELLARLPQGRFQKPEELGALVAFLASEPAAAITGAAIPAEGGMLQGLLS